MPIDVKAVQHVAALSRLELDPAEAPRFVKELQSILAYVEQLQKLDVGGIEPTSQVGAGGTTPLRGDAALPPEAPREAPAEGAGRKSYTATSLPTTRTWWSGSARRGRSRPGRPTATSSPWAPRPRTRPTCRREIRGTWSAFPAGPAAARPPRSRRSRRRSRWAPTRADRCASPRRSAGSMD